MTNLQVIFYVALIFTCCSCKKLSCLNDGGNNLENVMVTFDLCTNHDDICKTVDDTTYQGLQVSLENLGFDKSLKTVLIIHGFSNESPWMDEMAKKWLQSEPANVIAVRWPNNYNAKFEYTKSALLTELVADNISMFVMTLNWIYPNLNRNFHLIGHSLGAHIAGQTGRLLKKVGVEISRITGLDPANPCFEDSSASLRLRRTDAKFIDIIHINSDPTIKTLGTYEQMGTVDIYVNGGNLQPECEMQRVFGPADNSTLATENYSGMVRFKKFFGCDNIYENKELRNLREKLLPLSSALIKDDGGKYNITKWNEVISGVSKWITGTDLFPVFRSAFCQNSFCNHLIAPEFFTKMIDPAYPKKWASPVSSLPIKITRDLKSQNRMCYDEISDVGCIKVGTNTQDGSVTAGIYYIDTTDDVVDF